MLSRLLNIQIGDIRAGLYAAGEPKTRILGQAYC